MTGGLLPTSSHYFLQDTMKKISPSTTAILPGSGELYDFKQQGNNNKNSRQSNNRLSSSNDIIDLNILTPTSNNNTNIITVDCDSGVSEPSVLDVGISSVAHSSPKKQKVSSSKVKRCMRKRAVYRLATKFASVSPNTREITTDVLEELTNDNSRSSIVVDSFEDMGNSQDATTAVISILKQAKQAKTN